MAEVKDMDFYQIEKKWQERWEKKKIFQVSESSKKKKYYVLEQFPYPSGSGLHVGHSFIYTVGDIYARFKRMQGFNVLYPMGFDSFGLPAENAAIQAQSHPKKFTEEAIRNFKSQMKTFGYSYDWNRMIETHKPDFYKWDQWIFLKMFEKGLAYRKKSPVNWCPKCNTVLANEQVQNGKCWRHEETTVEIKQLEQWFFRTTSYADELYSNLEKLEWPEFIKTAQRNWIGKSHGTEIIFEIETERRPNFILLHGYTGSPKENFFPWLKKELEKRGYTVQVPVLPNTNNPDVSEQVDFVLKNCKFDEQTILLGHSLGSVIALKVLEKVKKPIRKLVLAAGFSEPKFLDKKRSFEKTFDWKFDFEKIKKNVSKIKILRATNDSAVPQERAETLQQHFGGEILDFTADNNPISGKEEHVVLQQCLETFPIFTTRPDTIFGVTFMVISAQHPQLMDFITEKHKTVAQKFLKKITSTKQEDMDKLGKEGVFTGSYARNPLNGEKVPIYASNFVVADYGSGMIMAVPAHDPRDFEFAKKYDIPIKPVVLKKSDESYSYVMGINEEDIKKIGITIIEKTKSGFFKIKIPPDKLEDYKAFIRKNMKAGFWNEFTTKKGFYFIFKHKDGKIEEMELNEKTNDIIDKYGMIFNGEIPKNNPENVYSWLAKNDFYKELLIHPGPGILINSEDFNGLDTEEAKEHITIYLVEKKLGRKAVNYKLKDWLISRQRFWGTPIPIVYCDKCGIVSVSEKDLPVKLPEDIKFNSTKNPLVNYKPFIEISCPKCKSLARQETDTMDTFVNSSWYFLRYCDPKNDKKIFDTKKTDYWMPIDIYIGGKEHATMHDIYFRFYTKFLRDIGLLKFDEPAVKLFNQGFILGENNEKMSKSKGNVVLLNEAAKKYGVDPTRLFLVSNASPESDKAWSNAGVEGSVKFIKKIIDYFAHFKSGKTSKRAESKMHKYTKEITAYISNFRYDLAVIRLRELFDILNEETISTKDAGIYLKLLHPFCPHVSEELWEKLGNKGFISLESWPEADETKIDQTIEKQDEAVNQVVNDVMNILKIMREKQGKEGEQIYLYALPNEVSFYNSERISIKIGKKVSVFAVNDKNKFDPEQKSGKTKPGKPGIYIV